MPAPKFRSDYDELKHIAGSFGHHSVSVANRVQRIQAALDTLQSGDWQGKGAQAFFKEMDQDVLPSLRRLHTALELAQQTTRQIIQVVQAAEHEAAAILRTLIAAGVSTDGGFLSGVGDFFAGAWDEVKDTASGLWQMVTDPVGTAQGLWYGITHPGALWDGFKQPYVEAWESGHPWRAVGRGTLFLGSLVVGTKGLDKVGKGSRVAGMADDLVRGADDLVRGADTAADTARVASRGPYLMPEGFQLPKKVDLPDAPTRQVLGQRIEAPIRDLVAEHYRIDLPTKPSSATGPDIVVPVGDRARLGFDVADVKPLNERGLRDFWKQLNSWRDYGWPGGPSGSGPGSPAMPNGRAAMFGYDEAGNVYLYGIFDM